jgi:hypothetical protein
MQGYGGKSDTGTDAKLLEEWGNVRFQGIVSRQNPLCVPES